MAWTSIPVSGTITWCGEKVHLRRVRHNSCEALFVPMEARVEYCPRCGAPNHMLEEDEVRRRLDETGAKM